jgi:hypothetical protein
MTLVELMVGSGIGFLVLAAVGSLITYTARSFASIADYVDLDQKSRFALDNVTRQIREMDALTSVSSNTVSFRSGGTNFSLVYDPVNKTLAQVAGTATKVLLSNCTACTFSTFQRNTVTNSFDQFPTSVSSNTVKLVQVKWLCSRTVVGAEITTETEQSAKVVIRNEK